MRRLQVPFLFLLLFPLALVAAQGTEYKFEGVSVSSYNDNTPFLYESNGGLSSTLGRGPDDQFTAGFRVDTIGSLKTPWSDSLLVSGNLAMFTDTQYYAIAETGSAAHPPWRLDAGSLQFVFEKAWHPFTVDYGLGGLVRGDLGGRFLQDTFHDAIRNIEFNVPYAGSYVVGPFVTGGLTYTFLDQDWAGWSWKASTTGRGVWDVLGVLNNELDALARLEFGTGAARFECSLGGRLSAPGSGANQANMYSTGLYFDDSVELSFDDFHIQVGYAVNPYGSAPISGYPDYRDQNQEFHWSVTWGRDIPVPWALRFFP